MKALLALLPLGGCAGRDSKVFLAVVPGDNNTVRVYACDGEDLAGQKPRGESRGQRWGVNYILVREPM
ncbi:MAG TPA: hypothetical protein VFC19_14790 [Candidatus Limnocylindrales bacterium]|nr:hypothetical protein [Candidatus Limnocylindrales bacterium]